MTLSASVALRLTLNASLLLFVFLFPRTNFFRFLTAYFGIFGVTLKLWNLLRKSILTVCSLNIIWEVSCLIYESVKRIFSHKPVKIECRQVPAGEAKMKPVVSYHSPLKDSYEPPVQTGPSVVSPLWAANARASSASLAALSPAKSVHGLQAAENASPKLSKRSSIAGLWNENLKLHLEKSPSPLLSSSSPNRPTVVSEPGKVEEAGKSEVEKPRKILVREILSPETSVQYCNMSYDLDVYIENVRQWFNRKIIVKLASEIQQVDRTLEASGLSHLCSKFPATYSMAAKSLDVVETPRSSFFLTTSNVISEPRIQTLMDLVQSRPNDPTVKLRLKIEKYLSLATISTHRASVIKRILALADGSFLNMYHATPSISQDSRPDPIDDAQILFHLFCTFMDENLPSENANETQPFSSHHFVPADEKPSARADAVQIQQVSSNPFLLQLIVEDKVMQAHPGYNNIFEVILFMVDFVHRRRKGYLGIGNLGSANIDLLSILKKH